MDGYLSDGPASTELCLPDKVLLQKQGARQKQNKTWANNIRITLNQNIHGQILLSGSPSVCVVNPCCRSFYLTDFKTQFICSASRKTTPYCCDCGERGPLPGKQIFGAIILFFFFNTCAGTSCAACNGWFSLMQTFETD